MHKKSHTALFKSPVTHALQVLIIGSLLVTMPAVSAVVISEIHYHPAEVGEAYPNFDDREDAEFIEIHNNGTSSVNLNGWSFTDGIDYVFPIGTSLPAGGYAVLARDAGVFSSVYGFNPLGEYSGKLSNGGENIELSNALGAVVSTVDYDDEGLWPVTPDEKGPSLELVNLTVSASDAANWSAATVNAGTPAQANSRNAPSTLPLVRSVSFSEIVGANQTVPVTITTTDTSTATLFYRVGFASEQTLTMSAQGAGQFQGVLPGQSAGALVRFRIQATGPGGSRTSPRSDDTIIYTGYAVADASTSNMPVLKWYVSPADYNQAYNNPFDKTPCNGQLCPAVVAYQGRIWDAVGFRVAGFTSRSRNKKHWRMEFPKSHLFDADFLDEPVDEFTVDAGFPNKDLMREALSWQVIGELGFPTIQTQHVRIDQNGAFYGVYLLREEQDGRWRERYNLDKGALYKFSDPTDKEGWSGNWEKKTLKSDNNVALGELRACLDETGSALRACLYEQVDVPNTIHEIASIALLRQIDQREFNFFLFHDLDNSGLWQILPDDLDRTFGLNNDQQIPAPIADLTKVDGRCLGTDTTPANELCRAMLRVGEFETMYYRRLRTLVDEYLVDGLIEPRIDALVALLQSDFEADRIAWDWSDFTLSQHQALLKGWLPAWRAHLQSGAYNGKVPAAQSTNLPVTIQAVDYQGNNATPSVTLRNTSTTDYIDLSDWQLSPLDTLPAGLVIAPGTTIILAHDPIAYRQSNPGNTLALLQLPGDLSATGGVLSLRRRDNTVVDTFTYGNGGALPVISISDVTVNENDGAVDLSLTLDQATAVPVSTGVFTRAGTALGGTDFYGFTVDPVVFAPGQTSQTVSLTLLNDTVVEPDETLTVHLYNASQATIGSSPATVTIRDDDTGAATLSVPDVNVVEGDSNSQAVVTLSGAVNSTVTVGVHTRRLSAQPSQDYYGFTAQLVFAPGVTSQFVNLPIIDDGIAEADESFQLRLYNASGADISQALGQVTIIDDDGGAVLSLDDATVNEGAGSLTVTINLSQALSSTVRVGIHTRSASALGGGQDFFGFSRQVVFQPGETAQSVTLTLNDDSIPEPTETVLLRLFDPVGAPLANELTTITIIDND